jgi:hypothetical protein
MFDMNIRAGFLQMFLDRVLCGDILIFNTIMRLKKIGNPKILQYRLGHNAPTMTSRYLSMLTQEDTLRVQQKGSLGVKL